jgi:tRNA U34 5-methylaminomethyl-2-thiouridine-forming methyltransferase MnmC
MTKKEIFITKDGSATLFMPEINETYHSKFGAIREAYHVFINAGFNQIDFPEINILEIGFGTGLNALITSIEAEISAKKVNYIGVEAYPVENEICLQLNYPEALNKEKSVEFFDKILTANWEENTTINESFRLNKRRQFFEDFTDENSFDLIYFDAFGFDVNPDLWNDEMFKKMYLALKPNGILVTYACRTSIKNAMIAAGFTIEKLPGAPGKREMLRATKK